MQQRMDEVTKPLQAEIERLRSDLRSSRAAYNAMLDKAAELERRLSPEPGATAVISNICPHCSDTFADTTDLRVHERSCSKNPALQEKSGGSL